MYKVGDKVRIKTSDNMPRDEHGWVDSIGFVSEMVLKFGCEVTIIEVFQNNHEADKYCYHIAGDRWIWSEGMLEPLFSFPEPFYNQCLVAYDGVELATIKNIKDDLPECLVISPSVKAGTIEMVPWGSLELVEEEQNSEFESLLKY